MNYYFFRNIYLLMSQLIKLFTRKIDNLPGVIVTTFFAYAISYFNASAIFTKVVLD